MAYDTVKTNVGQIFIDMYFVKVLNLLLHFAISPYAILVEISELQMQFSIAKRLQVRPSAQNPKLQFCSLRIAEEE